MGKMRNKLVMLAVIGVLSIVMAACGGKSQESVVKKIDSKLEDISGYKVTAEMKMKTGKEDRKYDVDVWYKKGKTDMYRVGLGNKSDENGQVILKNEEGVFVLTPALNKSFKFQTEWPENSSQPYLYQSVVEDVLKDKEATFSDADDYYVFKTKTNYQNNTNLPYQEVYFDKKTYAPAMVKVLDKDEQVLIEVAFTETSFDPEFGKNDFHRKSILEEKAADTSVAGTEEDAEEGTEEGAEEQQPLAVMFPLETMGAELSEKEEVTTEDGERVIMTFKGERNFTFIQERENSVPTAAAVEEMHGDVVDLGYSIGALSDHSVEWNYQGTDFVLASEDMSVEELIAVASSIQGQEIK